MEFYQQKASPKIGLTPLIDVVFILLLFFMLASNFDRWQQLPISAVSAGSIPSEPNAQVALRLFADGRLQVDGGKVYSLGDTQWLALLLSTQPEAVFTIQPEGGVPTQLLIDTAATLEQRGVSNLAFKR